MESKGSLIEIYHFINPLGRICYETEKTIIDFAKERYENVSIRFIPFVNLKIIKLQMERERRRLSLNEMNQLYTDAYQASLGFYAANMQGKKYGRYFLFKLQKAIIEDGRQVNLDTFKDVVDKSKIDLEMFFEDLNSSHTLNRFSSDQKLAQDMEIPSPPSCVVYVSSQSGVG